MIMNVIMKYIIGCTTVFHRIIGIGQIESKNVICG